MIISLSEKDHPKGKHIVLTFDRSEEIAGVARTIEEWIMLPGKDGNKQRPVRETKMRRVAGGDSVIDKVVYRFHLKYLERIALTFPYGEWTPNAEDYRRRELHEESVNGPVPSVVVPGFKGKQIYDYQKRAVIWTENQLQDYGSAMINSIMGSGKTVVCYAAISRDLSYFDRQEYKRILVVTTNSGKKVWWKIAKKPFYVDGREEEPAKFPDLDIQIIDGTRPQRTAQLREKHHITVINEQMLRTTGRGYVRSPADQYSYPKLFKRNWDLIVVDEYHHFRNPSVQVTKGFLRLATKNLVLMSGTPFLNRPEELWPAFNQVARDEWPDHSSFVRSLPIFGKNQKLIGYNRDTVKSIRDFLREHSIRQTEYDLNKEVALPKVMPPMEVRVEMTTEQRKLYEKLRDEFLLILADGNVKKVGVALAHITRLKQACFSPELYGGSKESTKMDKLKEIVKELVASGQKAIIFSQWEQACQIILREFGDYNPAYVTGKISTNDRSDQEDKFNEDPTCKLYIGTIDANQESISLGAATYVIFTDQPWNPYKKAQARDRSASGGLRGAHIGAKGKVHVIDLHAEDTIEEWIDEILAKKSRLFNALIEADMGTEIKKTTVSDIRSLLLGEVERTKVAA